MSEPRIIPIERVDLVFEPKPWPFADERRAEIDALFMQLRSAQPALFNGRVLLMHRFICDGRAMQGGFLETDYASFVAWQRWGRPSVGVYDCFGAAAIQAGDGAFLLGVMGPHTYNAGQIYFPCGTPDPSDIVGGRVDFEFSVRRELQEETGLRAEEFTAEPGWSLALDNELISAIKVFRSELDADALRARILDRLARERQPELSDIRIVRSVDDFDPKMRLFAKTFLSAKFGRA